MSSLAETDHLVSVHQVTLSDLDASTFYSFSVLVSDESGDLSRSLQYSFTTGQDSEGPQISAVNSRSTIIGNQDKVQTVITWSTNESSTSQVEYALGAAGDSYDQSSKENTDKVGNHIIVLSNLKSSTVYRFRVKSTDRSGNSSYSEPYVLLTPQKEVSAIDLIFKNLESIFGWTQKIGG